MNQKEGLAFAKEQGLLDDSDEFYKMFKKIARIKDLGGNDKIILSMILSYTERKLEFYMSNKRLAIESGMNYTSVIRILNTLRTKGIIKTYKVKNNNGMCVGRVVVPQKSIINIEVEKSFNNYTYEEYGQEDEI